MESDSEDDEEEDEVVIEVEQKQSSPHLQDGIMGREIIRMQVGFIWLAL